jgi:hypothetical protein
MQPRRYFLLSGEVIEIFRSGQLPLHHSASRSFIYTNPLRNVSITQKYISLKAEHHPSYYPAASQTLGPNLA